MQLMQLVQCNSSLATHTKLFYLMYLFSNILSFLQLWTLLLLWGGPGRIHADATPHATPSSQSTKKKGEIIGQISWKYFAKIVMVMAMMSMCVLCSQLFSLSQPSPSYSPSQTQHKLLLRYNLAFSKYFLSILGLASLMQI